MDRGLQDCSDSVFIHLIRIMRGPKDSLSQERKVFFSAMMIGV